MLDWTETADSSGTRLIASYEGSYLAAVSHMPAWGDSWLVSWMIGGRNYPTREEAVSAVEDAAGHWRTK